MSWEEREYEGFEVDEVIKETEKAFLMVIDGEEHWIPKSQMDDSDVVCVGDTDITIGLTTWFMKQAGL